MKTADNPRRPRFAAPEPKRERRIPEWRLQAEIIAHFHKLEAQGWPFTCAGDQNAEKRGVAARIKAKATGMTAGEPDVRCYLPQGRIGLIELKGDGGKLSVDQALRHARLRELGHEVVVLKVKTKDEAKREAEGVLRGWLARTQLH